MFPATLQHSDDNEWPAWGCVAAVGVYYACTTHLTSHGGPVAMNQCEELIGTIVPAWAWVNGAALPTVVGGDLNMTYRGDPDVQDCVPFGWFRKGDGNLQHIMATTLLHRPPGLARRTQQTLSPTRCGPPRVGRTFSFVTS